MGTEIVRSLLLIMLAFSSPVVGAAQVFRSVDSEGNVTYSDRPEGENVEAIFIATRRSTASSPLRTERNAPGARRLPPGAEETVEEVTREPTAEEQATRRAENCAIAREHLERYLVSHRLYRSTADGEREYLSDSEIDEARARAASDVEEWCD